MNSKRTARSVMQKVASISIARTTSVYDRILQKTAIHKEAGWGSPVTGRQDIIGRQLSDQATALRAIGIGAGTNAADDTPGNREYVEGLEQAAGDINAGNYDTPAARQAIGQSNIGVARGKALGLGLLGGVGGFIGGHLGGRGKMKGVTSAVTGLAGGLAGYMGGKTKYLDPTKEYYGQK